MQMNGINELITIGKYWKGWQNPQLVILVLANQDLNQVTWEMRAQAGNPKFEASQSIPEFPFARYAELIGLKGIRVDDPEKLGSAWDEAFQANRPVVLEAVTDPNTPPLPPHITLENAKAFMSTLWSVDPEQGSMIKQSVKQLVSDYLPSKS